MEELKILVGMVKDLPAMALWIIAGFFAYKVFIVGSIYGVIKLGINRVYDSIKSSHNANEKIASDKLKMDEYSKIGRELDSFVYCSPGQLFVALKDIGGGNFHESDLRWLKKQIREREK